MASNVFGNPITNDTLKGMPEYSERPIIWRKDRAKVAMLLKNAETKDVNARTHVEQLKANWGVGVSTLCLVYNATGDAIKFVGNHDWYGHIGPSPYPNRIENGQWGAFLHVKTSGAATGSVGAVVYRGRNNAGIECDWMIAWDTPWNRHLFDNRVYTEIRERDHFHTMWGPIRGIIQRNRTCLEHSDTWGGCTSTVTTGSFTSPVFEAVLSLDQDAGDVIDINNCILLCV